MFDLTAPWNRRGLCDVTLRCCERSGDTEQHHAAKSVKWPKSVHLHPLHHTENTAEPPDVWNALF